MCISKLCLISFRSLKVVIWATLLMEKEVPGTGCPTSTVRVSPWSRTWLPSNVKGRSFMKAARRSTRTKSSLCGMEIAMRSFWTFPWACRSWSRGSRRLGPRKVSARFRFPQWGRLSGRTGLFLRLNTFLPAAFPLACGTSPSRHNTQNTKLRASLTSWALPSCGKMPSSSQGCWSYSYSPVYPFFYPFTRSQRIK